MEKNNTINHELRKRLKDLYIGHLCTEIQFEIISSIRGPIYNEFLFNNIIATEVENRLGNDWNIIL